MVAYSPRRKKKARQKSSLSIFDVFWNFNFILFLSTRPHINKMYVQKAIAKILITRTTAGKSQNNKQLTVDFCSSVQTR